MQQVEKIFAKRDAAFARNGRHGKASFSTEGETVKKRRESA
jgi:hypothetical protein